MPASAPSLILASQSPRRAQLLQLLGLSFRIEPAEVDETPEPGENPESLAERLACAKSEAVARRCPDALVIGSDTVVDLAGELLGKPEDVDEAVRMLLRLQGREHRVLTGVALSPPGADPVSGVEIVRVRFRPFDEATARAYARTGEPMDKAGAYGIQGYGAALVEWIEGDFFAVMGLPLLRLTRLFEACGWRYNFAGLEPIR